MVRDDFRALNGYNWDYVIIFKVYKNDEILEKFQEEYSMKYILNQLASGGIHTKMFYNSKRDQVYCKIRAPLNRLGLEALRIEYKLPLCPHSIRNYLKTGKRKTDGKWIWHPIEIPEYSYLTKIPPFEFIYAPYVEDSAIIPLYETRENNTIFRYLAIALTLAHFTSLTHSLYLQLLPTFNFFLRCF